MSEKATGQAGVRRVPSALTACEGTATPRQMNVSTRRSRCAFAAMGSLPARAARQLVHRDGSRGDLVLRWPRLVAAHGPGATAGPHRLDVRVRRLATASRVVRRHRRGRPELLPDRHLVVRRRHLDATHAGCWAAVATLCRVCVRVRKRPPLSVPWPRRRPRVARYQADSGHRSSRPRRRHPVPRRELRCPGNQTTRRSVD